MLKSALEYLIGLGKNEIVEVNEQSYSTKPLHLVKYPQAETLQLTTLTGLLDYIRENPDDLHMPEMIIHVVAPDRVNLYSNLNVDWSRDCFISCRPLLPKIEYARFMDAESFNIMVQSCFVQDESTAELLKVVGNLKEENVRQIGDDGVSQEVTVKTGIARVANAPVPNPVVLALFRTFPEIVQPASKFIFRMQDGMLCAVFEADGGAWRNCAIASIKEYLQEQLQDVKVKIIA